MRLPWPFGRAQRSASADGVAGSEGGSAPRPERASGDAWRELPPLSETVGPPPLVAPNRPFAAGLASKEPPAPILKPLSHGRSLEAPRGLVSGIARPTSVAGPALPAPVQRSPIGGRRASGDEDASWASPAADPDPEPQSGAVAPAGPAPASPSGAVASTAPATVPATAPTLRLPAVTAAAPARTLTRAPEPARAAPPMGLVGQPRVSASGRAATTSTAPVPTAGIQRSPAAPAAAPSATQPQAGSSAASPAPVTGAPRLTIGQARRLGLGAPVAGGPITTTTQAFHRAQQGSPVAPAGSPAVHVTRTPAPALGVQRAPEPDVPDMPLAAGPAATTRSEGGPGGDAAAPAMPPLDVGSAPAVAGRPIGSGPQRAPVRPGAPIVSAQPLRTGLQRAPLTLPQRAEEAGGGAATPAGSTSSSSRPVKIHRDGEAGQLSKALDARSFTHGGEIFLPASHGPLTSGTGKALLAHELTHVAQQRRLGSSLPNEQSPHGKSLESEAVAAERSPDMTLALPQSGQAPAAPTSAVGSEAPSPSGMTAMHAPGPQRAPAEGGGAARSEGSGRGGQRGSGHTHTEQELEVLAHQLYHRIGRHLRRELLVDRERVGFALDLP